MDPPPVQFVRTKDGLSIAYGVSGEGQPLVFLNGSLGHIQLSWQHPALSPWLEALANRFQLVQYDIRGEGMSSQGLSPTTEMEDFRLDIEAVADGLGLKKFVILASLGHTVYIAVDYAVHHPDRVSALVLLSPAASVQTFRAPGLFRVLPSEDWRIFWLSLLQDRSELVDLYLQAHNQHDFVLLIDAFNRKRMDDILPELSTPTLVIFPRDERHISVAEATRVAQMARAQIVLISGSFTTGDATEGLRAITSFLASLPEDALASGGSGAGPDRLSLREIDVLRLIAAGRTNQQIADELVISFNTVQRHVGNILSKTGLANRTEAAGYARDKGML